MLVLAAAATGATVRPKAASMSREDRVRAEIVQLLNAERAERRLPLLQVDADLQRRAQTRAERNQAAGCGPLSDCHSPDADAEILGRGDQDSTAGAIVVAWMQSDIDRDVLLHSQATAFGVGFSCGTNGRVYATVKLAGIRAPVLPTPVGPIATAPHAGTACTTTPTRPPTMELSANAAAQRVGDVPRGGATEAGWIGMVVVVVFLSTLRIGFQLRDVAATHSEHRVTGRGL